MKWKKFCIATMYYCNEMAFGGLIVRLAVISELRALSRRTAGSFGQRA